MLVSLVLGWEGRRLVNDGGVVFVTVVGEKKFNKAPWYFG